MKFKPAFFTFILLLVGLSFLFSPFMNGQKKAADTLVEIYRQGKINLVKELVIDQSNLPAEVVLASPIDLSLDSAGNLYLLDFRESNIKKFDPKGKFLQVIGRPGQGPGEFNAPFSLAIASDRILVWDMRNRRLTTVSLTGQYLTSANQTQLKGRPWRVKALPDGRFIVETKKIYFADPQKPQEVFLELLSPELEVKKVIYSHSVWENKFIRFGEGGLANVPLPFSPRVHWDVLPQGKIVIGYSENYEFSLYTLQGEEIKKITRPYQPVKVTKEDRKNHFARMTFSSSDGTTQKGAPDFIVKNTTFPRYKPAYRGLMVDSEGNILIQPYLKDKRKMERTLDVFDSQGNFIQRIEVSGIEGSLLPRSCLCWQGKFIWLSERDAEGLPIIVKYRVTASPKKN